MRVTVSPFSAFGSMLCPEGVELGGFVDGLGPLQLKETR